MITVGARCEWVEVASSQGAAHTYMDMDMDMEGADDLPPDDEGDAAGPAALLRAAAELIVLSCMIGTVRLDRDQVVITVGSWHPGSRYCRTVLDPSYNRDKTYHGWSRSAMRNGRSTVGVARSDTPSIVCVLRPGGWVHTHSSAP